MTLALVASAVSAGAASVVRSVTNDIPSRPLVSLAVTGAAENRCHAFDELLPATLTATNITAGGVWLPEVRTIHWGPFTNAPAVELAYRVFGPSGTYVPVGRLSADGKLAFTPVEVPVIIAAEGGGDMPVRPGNVAPPVIMPLGSTSLPVTVTISCATTGAVIRYTTDGTPPQPSSTLYTGAVEVVTSTLIRAGAFASNAFPSATRSAWFTQTTPRPTLATTRSVATNTPWLPEVSVVATQATGGLCWAYEEALPSGLTVSNLTENGVFDPANQGIKWGPFLGRSGAILSYQVAGSAGSHSLRGRSSVDGHSTEESSPGTVTVAPAPGGDDGGVPIRPGYVAPPVITPLGSTNLPVTVTLSCVTTGAVIRYTLDGTVPEGNAEAYTGAVTVASTTWVRARSFAPNAFPSAVRSAYFSQAAAVSTPQLGFQVLTNTPWLPEVQIAVTQPATGLCWAYELWLPAGLTASNVTENGVFDASNRVVRWGPLVDRSNAVLACSVAGRAGTYSLRGGWSQDGQSGATSEIVVSVTGESGDNGIPPRPQLVARPVLNPAGSGQLPVTVSVLSATPDAELRYTLDGTPPTRQSALYTNALSFTNDTVLRVRGFKDGLEPSYFTAGRYVRANTNATLQVTRTISANGTPSPAVELLVVPPAGIKWFAVTETIPERLAPYLINHNGAWDETNWVVKWGPFFGSDVVRLQYMLSGMPGTHRLVGAGSADGVGNVTTGPDMIELAAQDQLPDLHPLTPMLGNEPASERSIAVTYSVTNSGKGFAAAHWTDRWYDTFYLSRDASLDASDTLLGRFIGNGGFTLPANAAYTNSGSVMLPALSEGTYYLILKTDERSLVNEVDEANNVVAIPIAIPASDGSPERVLEVPAGWSTTAGDLDFSPDGVRLAVAAGNRVAVWNLQSHASASNALLGSFTGHGASVSTVDFSPANDEVLSGSSDGTIRVWDARTFAEARSFPSTSGEPSPAVFSPDGAQVLGGAARGLARIWDAVTTNALGSLAGHSAAITAVAFSPDGARALTGSSDKSAILWNAATGTILYRWTNHTHIVSAVAFSRDGSRALTASSDGTIRIWDPATGAAVAVLRQGRPLSDAVFSPDGLYVAAADRGLPGMAYLWEVSSQRLLQTFRPFNVNPSTVEGIAFSPDRAAIATSHSDGRVRLWNSGLTAIPIHTAVPLPLATDVPVTMRSHGLYYFEIEVPANRSLVVTVDAVASGGSGKTAFAKSGGTGMEALSADVRFANRGQNQGAAKAGLLKTSAIGDFPAESDIEAFRVLATRGHLPSVYEYDNFAQAFVSNLHAEVPLSVNETNKCYVLVFAPWLSAGQINATIKAEFTSLHLSSISHQRGGNAGSITVQMHGTAFGSNTVAMLTQYGGAVITAAPLYPPLPSEMEVRFDLRSATPGTYDVVVADGREVATIPRGFEIVGGGVGAVRATTFVPSIVRAGRATDFSILVKNEGMTDVGPLAIKASLSGSTAPFWVGVVPQLAPHGQTPIGVPMPLIGPGCDTLTVTTGDPKKENCEIQDRILSAWRAIIAAEEATLKVIRDDLASECGNVLPRNSPERCERLHHDEVKLEGHIFELRQLCCNLCRARNASCPDDDPDDCGECTQLLQNPTDHVDSKWDAGFCAVRAVDPNDMLGPAGFGPERLVSGRDDLGYTIRFENIGTATAPVQELVVVDYLDPNLDWSTVEFGEIRYGDRVITVPAGQLSFSTRDLPPTNSIAITGITVGKLAVDMTATFNSQNGRLEWRLLAKDTANNQFPYDALAGFLPPNNTNTHCGEGHLTFRVKPKLGLEIGTRIENKASIVFDLNDPIETPPVTNTIGQVAPKLGASLAYPASQMHLGMPFTMSLTVSNSGITTATNIFVTNAIPAGFAFVDATSTVGTVTYTNGNVIWTIGTLSNGFPAILNQTLLPNQIGNFVAPIRIRGADGLYLDLDPLFTVQPPLVLGIRLNSGQVELFWSTNFSSHHLQWASTLSVSNQWTDLTNAPVIVGQEYRVTNGLPAATRFYRLAAPSTAAPPNP